MRQDHAKSPSTPRHAADRFEPSSGAVNVWNALVLVAAVAFFGRIVIEATQPAGGEVATAAAESAADPS